MPAAAACASTATTRRTIPRVTSSTPQAASATSASAPASGASIERSSALRASTPAVVSVDSGTVSTAL